MIADKVSGHVIFTVRYGATDTLSPFRGSVRPSGVSGEKLSAARLAHGAVKTHGFHLHMRCCTPGVVKILQVYRPATCCLPNTKIREIVKRLTKSGNVQPFRVGTRRIAQHGVISCR